MNLSIAMFQFWRGYSKNGYNLLYSSAETEYVHSPLLSAGIWGWIQKQHACKALENPHRHCAEWHFAYHRSKPCPCALKLWRRRICWFWNRLGPEACQGRTHWKQHHEFHCVGQWVYEVTFLIYQRFGSNGHITPLLPNYTSRRHVPSYTGILFFI